MKKICVLVSGSGTNLQRIIDATRTGEIENAAVSLVVADRDCYALQRAADVGIESVLIPRGKNLSQKLLEVIPSDIDLIVLAGFLSILQSEFCTHFSGKIINIHPALLPKYGGKGMWGAHVHEAVLAAGEKESGATVHFVTPGIDEGDIILQQSFEIDENDTAEILAQKVHAIEYELLPRAVNQLLNTEKSIAFITDLHMLEKSVTKKGVDTLKNWKNVLQDIRAKGITEVVLGGDLGEKSALENIFNDLKDFNVNVILGNHDNFADFEGFNLKSEGRQELFYTSEIFGNNCIFLDTSSYRLSLAQQKFLEKWLSEADEPKIFIHHPVIGDKSWMDREHPLKNADEILKILQTSGKNITLISGHYHHFNDLKNGNIRQLISPAVSYQIANTVKYQADTNTYGYLQLTFRGQKLHAECVIFKN